MRTADYPVNMYCPIRDTEETVYFRTKEIDGKWRVHIDNFNGCDHEYHACQECEDCKKSAFEKMRNTTK